MVANPQQINESLEAQVLDLERKLKVTKALKKLEDYETRIALQREFLKNPTSDFSADVPGNPFLYSLLVVRNGGGSKGPGGHGPNGEFPKCPVDGCDNHGWAPAMGHLCPTHRKEYAYRKETKQIILKTIGEVTYQSKR